MTDSLNQFQRVPVPLANPGAYTTGQSIGTTLALLGLGLGGGILTSVRIADIGQSGLMDIVFYDSLPTTPASDRTTFAGVNNRAKVLGVAHVASTNVYTALGASAGLVAATFDSSVQFGPTYDGNLYAQLVARGSITYATGDLYLSVGKSG